MIYQLYLLNDSNPASAFGVFQWSCGNDPNHQKRQTFSTVSHDLRFENPQTQQTVSDLQAPRWFGRPGDQQIPLKTSIAEKPGPFFIRHLRSPSSRWRSTEDRVRDVGQRNTFVCQERSSPPRETRLAFRRTASRIHEDLRLHFFQAVAVAGDTSCDLWSAPTERVEWPESQTRGELTAASDETETENPDPLAASDTGAAAGSVQHLWEHQRAFQIRFPPVSIRSFRESARRPPRDLSTSQEVHAIDVNCSMQSDIGLCSRRSSRRIVRPKAKRLRR